MVFGLKKALTLVRIISASSGGENKLKDFKFSPKLQGYAIKQPVFSFNKFPDVNKQLGPEMKSTGESILFINDLNDDDFFELYSRRKMYLTK